MTGTVCLNRIRSREVSRRRVAGYVRVAGRVDGNSVSDVDTVTAEVCRVDQGRTGAVQLGDERVAQTSQARMQCVEYGKIRGTGLAGYVSIAGVVDSDARSGVGTRAADESRVDECGTVSIELRDERVCQAAVCGYHRHAGWKIQ